MLERLSAPNQPQHPAICFTYWLQWHLSRQLKSASEYARQHQIALKGDLPIGGLFCHIACQCLGHGTADPYVLAGGNAGMHMLPAQQSSL